MELCAWLSVLATFLTQFSFVKAQGYCSGTSFWCNTGHCCKGGRCCSYYYELWWFWAIWAGVILLSCCCLFQQQRVRQQHRSHHRQRLRLPPARCRSRFAQALDTTFPALFNTDRGLPTYDEIKGRPENPPPYDQLNEICLPESSINCPVPPPYDPPSEMCLQESTTSSAAPSTNCLPPLIPSSVLSSQIVEITPSSGEMPSDPPPPYSSKTSISEPRISV